MFKNILFATSATEACDYAARVAFEIAQRYGAGLTVFHVLGVPTRGYSQMVRDVKTGETVSVDDEYRDWVKEELKTYYTEQLERYGAARLEVAVGYPHREVLRYARKHQPDLIVMGGSTGAEDSSALKKSMAGSSLQMVAKSAPCPVLVVARPAASFWGGISSIVFGTDFSKASDAAFTFALKTAKSLDCELNLFHAVDISGVHAGKVLAQDDIEIKLREARNRIRGRYAKQLGDFKRYSMEVWEGLPYVEIVKFAREKQADLIVMAHHTRETSADAVRLGSNMEQVIMRATCPVVSVNRPQPA
jgi:nucleotide-binding universal stress UspA family protein